MTISEIYLHLHHLSDETIVDHGPLIDLLEDVDELVEWII